MPYSHLSPEEVTKADQMQKTGKTPKQILSALQKQRLKHNRKGPSEATVYRFVSGKTHQRGCEEQRGRPENLPKGLIRVAETQRRKLIKSAKNEYLVTWGDIHKAVVAQPRRPRTEYSHHRSHVETSSFGASFKATVLCLT